MCFQCPDICRNCNGSGNSDCLDCSNNTFFFEGGCYQECPQFYYKNYELNICSFCHYSCKSCIGPNINDCTSCENKTRAFQNETFNSNFSIKAGVCMCRPGYYVDLSSLYCFGFFFFILKLYFLWSMSLHMFWMFRPWLWYVFVLPRNSRQITKLHLCRQWVSLFIKSDWLSSKNVPW